MFSSSPHSSKLFISLLIGIILTNPLQSIRAQVAQHQQYIRVTAGKPSVWTLEQAHYLLAAMRDANKGLKIKSVEPNDLDPNQVNRQRIETLRTILSISGSYDQTEAFKNSTVVDQYQDNRQRLDERRRRRDVYFDQKLLITRKIGELNSQINQLQSATPLNTDAIRLKQGELTGQEAERDVIDVHLSELQKEIASLETTVSSAPTVSSGGGLGTLTQLPTQSASPSAATLDHLLQKLNTGAPKLEASQMLDNYIQMQYELIAKQLTLLRDEVGPRERLIFLELPTSIYTVPGRGDRMLAQARWKVTHYKKLKAGKESSRVPEYVVTGAYEDTQISYVANRAVPLNKDDLEEVAVTLGDVRVVDMIPAQSYLNVTQTYGSQKSIGIATRFAALFGFGAKVDYERQRDTFEQFVNQEVFAAGFGKGEHEFGWTFGAKPGTKQVAPGVRTTYAILSIPKEAVEIRLASEGMGFDRNTLPPVIAANENCTIQRCYSIIIPDLNYWNDGGQLNIDYTSVRPNQRVTAILSGLYFSPQVGVLVNGVPLQRVLAVAQFQRTEKAVTGSEGSTTPALQITAAGGNEAPNSGIVEGSFEYINARKLVLHFSMGPQYEGTPIITVIAPETTYDINTMLAGEGCPKTVDLKRLDLSASCYTLQYLSSTKPMFLAPLNISSVINAEKIILDGNLLMRVIVIGSGFRKGTFFSVNDEIQHDGSRQLSDKEFLLWLLPNIEQPWTITAIHNNGQGIERKSAVFNDVPITDQSQNKKPADAKIIRKP